MSSSIKVTPGQCWICDTPIDSGIYCSKCQPSTNLQPAKTKIPVIATHSHQYTTVAELRNGFTVYISPMSIFYKARYWVFNSAVVRSDPQDGFEVKIRRSLTGKLFIDAGTLELDKIGTLNQGESRFYQPAELEIGTESSTPPQSYAMSGNNRKVSEMVDGDQGFTEPYAIFEMNQQLFIVSGAGVVSNKNDLYKTMQIRKRKGIIEINERTVNTDEIVPGYDGIENEMEFEKATMIPHF